MRMKMPEPIILADKIGIGMKIALMSTIAPIMNEVMNT